MAVLFENKTSYVADVEKKDVKGVYGSFVVLKEKSRYIFAIRISNRKDSFFVIRSSKKLSDLSFEVDYEKPEIMGVLFNNAVYDRKFGVLRAIPCPENRSLKVGDLCEYGLSKGTVLKTNGEFYYIRHNQDGKLTYQTLHWRDVFPCNENPVEIEFSQDLVKYTNSSIDELLNKYFDYGVDMEPEYQRDNVWTEEQEVKLIDSIYKKISIGSFVFAEKIWASKHEIIGDQYEIVDGKQRLTAIINYVSGKFKYNGVYFHQLDRFTRRRFGSSDATVGVLRFGGEDYNRELVLETFIRLNECGTSMKKETIENAKKLLG